MADKFVRLKSLETPEHEQMLIYSTLRSYKKLPMEEREYIRTLCADVGAEWGAVLFRFLTTGESFQQAISRSRIPEGLLRKMRLEVYLKWHN